jgi:hypothetical protein
LADADRDVDLAPGAFTRISLLGFLLRAVFPSQGEASLSDRLSQALKVGCGFVQFLPGEEDCEFLPAIAERLASAGNLSDREGDILQGLVPHIMSVSVVELLKDVDVHHHNCVVSACRCNHNRQETNSSTNGTDSRYSVLATPSFIPHVF